MSTTTTKTTEQRERCSLFTPSAEKRGIRIETRAGAEGEAEKRVAIGYAAVFYNAAEPGTEYELWDDFRERILPGAFDRAIRENQDVRALFNHRAEAVLGRTKASTLRLSVDAVGLRYEIDLPATSLADDLAVSLGRGDVDGSSFSFVPVATVWREESGVLIRELVDVDLLDVGPVTFPAYTATTAGIRSESDREELRREAAAALGKRPHGSAAVDVDHRFREVQERERRLAGKSGG